MKSKSHIPIVIATAFMILLPFAAKADQILYMDNISYSGGTIQSYSTSGSLINSSLISGISYSSMALDNNGYLYASTSVNNHIFKYTTSGIKVNTFDIPILSYGITIGVDGYLYVADYYNHQIGKYDTAGNAINASFISGISVQPTAIAIDNTGNIFVATLSYINEYNSSGSLIHDHLISGLQSPNQLVLDGSGNLYVNNRSDMTIEKFSTSGAAVSTNFITGLNDPEGLALDGNGNLFVADQANSGRVGVYSASSGAAVNANLISGQGLITGIAISQVPEPSTYALCGLGALALVIAARRKVF